MTRANRRCAALLASAALALLVPLTSCAAPVPGSAAAETDGVAAHSGARIEVASDLPEHWAVGEEAQPLSVVVYDGDDEPAVQEQVTFRIASGAAALADGLFVAETGEDGVATVFGITPSAAGEITIEVATGQLLELLVFEAR